MSKIDVEALFAEFKSAAEYDLEDMDTFLFNMFQGDDFYVDPEIARAFEFEHLFEEGGGEGGSEYCEGVISFRGKFYQANWGYYSHQGYDYEYIEATVIEVKPKNINKIIYVAV